MLNRCSIDFQLLAFTCRLRFRFDQEGQHLSFRPKRSPAFASTKKSPASVSTEAITSLCFNQNDHQPKKSPSFAFVSTEKVTNLRFNHKITSFPFKQNGHQLSLKTQRVASLRFNQTNRQPLLQPKRITRSRVNQSGRQPPFQPKRSQASVTLKKVVGPCYIVKSPFT